MHIVSQFGKGKMLCYLSRRNNLKEITPGVAKLKLLQPGR